jgi:3-phosphoshikimate 1-carboxyvinyltransferase
VPKRLMVWPASRGLTGELRPPGDKSLSHRALIFGSLAEGETGIRGLLPSEDVRATTAALRQLGVDIAEGHGTARVQGIGRRGFCAPQQTLDMGNSGTAMRLLAGVLAAQPFKCTLTGDASLSGRPMRRIIDPLRQMGAEIHGSASGTPPLQIEGRSLRGIDYLSPVASAQVKSCLLLAGLFAAGRTRVREPLLSRDHSERMLSLFGAPLDADGWLPGGSVLHGTEVGIPADPSSAAFTLAAALLVPGSDIVLQHVGLNPTRTGILEAVQAMGGNLEISASAETACEPVGDIRVRYAGRLRAIHIGANEVPSMVDEIPVLMALAATADGVTRIRGAAELRVKESDRLAVMGRALEKLGVTVTLYDDGVDIEGVEQIVSASRLDSAGDHRCAMSLAVLGLATRDGVEVSGAEYIGTSYPEFDGDLRTLGAILELEDAA